MASKDFIVKNGLVVGGSSANGTLSAGTGTFSTSLSTVSLSSTNIYTGGSVGIGTSIPTEALTVSGNISASGTVCADAFNSVTGGSAISFNDPVTLSGNLTGVTVCGTSSILSPVLSSTNIYAGDIGVDQKICHNGDPTTYLNFTECRLRFNIGGISYIDLNDAGAQPHDFTVNDGGNDVDFIIKGSGNNEGNPLFKTDASKNRVGINGVGSPESELEVDGTILATGSDPRIGIGTTSPNEALTVSGNVSATGTTSVATIMIDSGTAVYDSDEWSTGGVTLQSTYANVGDGSTSALFTIPMAKYRSGKILVQAVAMGVGTNPNTSHQEVTELLFIHNGSDVNMIEYATVGIGTTTIASYAAGIESTNVVISATAASPSNSVVQFIGTITQLHTTQV